MGIHEIKTSSPAVFFDRDGIINVAIVKDGHPYPPASLDELHLISGTVESMKRLSKSGFALFGVTNQPDVARGTQTQAMVEKINNFITSHTPIKEILVCYHDNQDLCDCRKPKPGLIYQAEEKYSLDLSQSWMVGDRWQDIAAGQAAGLKTIFVDYKYSIQFEGKRANYNIGDPVSIANIILEGSK